MARIRTIKPEFWTSEQVMSCSPNARLLFIGLWNFCDDQGRHVFSPRQIKAEIMPGDDVSSENVRGMLDELSAAGLIEVYRVDEKQYLQVTGWHHQRIDKAQKPRHPAKPANHSENAPRTFAPESIGKERKGVEEKKDAAPDGAPSNVPGNAPVSTEEADLFRRGKVVLGKNAGGLIAKLVKAKGGNVSLARAAIETAATKSDAREYIGGIVRGRDPPADGDLWDRGL